MISSGEEAIPFFTRWRDDRTLLRVLFVSTGFSISSFAYVSEVNNDGLVLFHESIQLVSELNFNSVLRYDFITPTDSTPEHRSQLEAYRLTNGWMLRLVSGALLSIYDIEP